MAKRKKQAYGTGVFEKYPNIWYARWVDLDGRRHVERAGPKQAAINLYRRRKDEMLQGKKFPENLRRGVKFSDIAQDALNYVRDEGRAAGKLAFVATWFPNRDAASITRNDIKRELNRLRREGHRIKSRGLSPATRNRFKAALSFIFTLALENGKVTSNPARLVRMEKENNERVRFLSEQEESRLRAQVREASPERVAELDLALHTGLRRGEQYSLRWRDVDLLNRTLTVRRGKGNKKRHVRLNANALAALAALRLRDDGSGYVCPGALSKDGYWASRFWFKRALAAASVDDFTWHDLRHTFASRLVQRGVDIVRVKELMGHATISMTMRYAHLAPVHLQNAVDAIATLPVDDDGRAGEHVTLPVN